MNELNPDSDERPCLKCNGNMIKLYRHLKSFPGTLDGKFVVVGWGCEKCHATTF